MKKGFVKLLASLLGVTCILTGCGGLDKKEKVAMGRYVEEKMMFEGMTEGKMPRCNFFENREGNVEILTENFSEEGGVVVETECYTPNEAGVWQKTDEELSKAIMSQGYTSINFIQKDKKTGELYLKAYKEEEGLGLEGIQRINEDNSFEEIKIDWQSQKAYYMDDIIYNNQLFTIEYSGGERNIEQYDIKTGKWIKNIGEDVSDFAVLNDKLYVISSNGGSRVLECYDIETGKQISKIDIEVSYGCSMVASENQKGIYIFCDEGIYYIAEEEQIPELIIDGKRYTISTPSAYMEDVYVHNGIFYIQYNLEDEFVCKQYSYHKELPTVPEKTLTIFSLGKCESLQTAARIYADEHPEVCVEVEVVERYFDSLEKEAKNQAIEAINTQILAGEGPDIIVLDGLPMQSYIEKGVLGDMTNILNEIEKSGTYYDSLMRAYEKDEKLYALPLSFTLLSAVGESELVQDGFSLEKLAAYQKQHPDEQVLGNIKPEDLLQKISSTYQSKLFDEEGKIDDKQLVELLENINTLAPRKEEMYDMGNKGNMYYQPYRIYQAMNHEIKTTLEEVDGAMGLQYLLHTYAQLNHGTIAPNIEGESKMVNLKQLIGINAKTDKLEEIQELMKVVYSKEIAEKRFSEFSIQQEVNESVILGEQMQSSAYSEEAHPLKEWGISFGVTNEKGGMDIKDYNVWYSDEGKYYIEALKNAQALMPMDKQVLDIIQNEAEGYFKGEISVDAAVEKIKQKVEVYLSEQQ